MKNKKDEKLKMEELAVCMGTILAMHVIKESEDGFLKHLEKQCKTNSDKEKYLMK